MSRHEALVAALKQLWDEGSPVAGHSAERWNEIASRTERRIQSHSRRGVVAGDEAGRVRDLAKGLAQAFESEANVSGPMLREYEHIAERLLAVYVENSAQVHRLS